MHRQLLAYVLAFLMVSAFAAPAANAAVFDTDDCVELAVQPEETVSIARGDDIIKEPTIDEPTEALPASAKGKGGPKFRETVPVYFHVVSPDGVIGNVTDAQIMEQIDVMNLAFNGTYGGVNTGFRFELVAITRSVNAEWYNAGPGTSAEREMKKALTRNAPQALNYYSTTAGPYLGWAYFPGLPASRMFLDGIVVDWESMVHTSTRYAGRFDLGLTAVHEAGHWVGLHHTFNGGCNNWGDYVEDTPPMRVPTSRCPIGKDTCPEPGLDPIHNYMDYSDDQCYFEFTAGQALRAQDFWLHFRQ